MAKKDYHHIGNQHHFNPLARGCIKSIGKAIIITGFAVASYFAVKKAIEYCPKSSELPPVHPISAIYSPLEAKLT